MTWQLFGQIALLIWIVTICVAFIIYILWGGEIKR